MSYGPPDPRTYSSLAGPPRSLVPAQYSAGQPVAVALSTPQWLGVVAVAAVVAIVVAGVLVALFMAVGARDIEPPWYPDEPWMDDSGDWGGGEGDATFGPTYNFPGNWTEGTTYAIKTVGTGFESFTRYEITGVTDDEVTYVMTMLGADLEPMAGMEPTEMSHLASSYAPADFDDYVVPPDAPDFTVEYGDVEAAGHTFWCMISAGSGTRTSIALDYPGLIVGMESDVATMELIEFAPG